MIGLFIAQVSIGQVEPAVGKSINYLRTLKEKLSVPGLSVCVAVKGKIMWQQGLGFANLEQKIPVTTKTQFRVGSIAKCMTSLAVGKLHDQGLLKLDENVQTYVPYFPQKKYAFTVRQLAGHLSGIPHYDRKDPVVKKHYTSVKTSMKIFDQRPLLFEPGTQYQYSSYGYVLLSAVVEGASKNNYLNYMRHQLFKPLRMAHTVPDDITEKMPQRAQLYHVLAPNYRKTTPIELLKQIKIYQVHQGEVTTIPASYDEDVSYKWAGGGFLSTPTDLVNMLLNKDKVVKAKTFQTLSTPQKFKNGKATGKKYGMGWRQELAKDKKRVLIHHGGASTGGRAFLLYLPKEEVIVAIAANALVRIGLKDAYQIAKYFLGE